MALGPKIFVAGADIDGAPSRCPNCGSNDFREESRSSRFVTFKCGTCRTSKMRSISDGANERVRTMHGAGQKLHPWY